MHNDVLSHELAKILATQHSELILLALEAYYKANTFSVNICDPRQSITFQHPPLAYGVYIQRIDITIWNCVLADTLEDMLLTPGSGWYYLFIPTRTLRVDTSMTSCKRTRVSEYIGGTDWQLHFPNLKTLKLLVVVRDFPHRGLEYQCGQCRTRSDLVNIAEKALEGAEIRILAGKVEVSVKGVCGVGKKVGRPKRCKCLGVLKRRIGGMVGVGA
jgi:hypothetical protein